MTNIITEEDVLRILKTHKINNNESLVRELNLAFFITLKQFDPKTYQLPLITLLINKVVNEGIRVLVLNFPTGIGKSFISAALTILLDFYGISKISSVGKSVTLTFRNNLFQQYEKSFPFMYSIKGKGNYTCIQDYRTISKKTKCISSPQGSAICESRTMCEYFLQNSNLFKSKSLITNYHWFIFNLYSKSLNRLSNILVFDEIHTVFDILNELFNLGMDKFNDIYRIIHIITESELEFEESTIYNLVKSNRHSDVLEVVQELIPVIYSEPDYEKFIPLTDKLIDSLKTAEILQDYLINADDKSERIRQAFSQLGLIKNDNVVKIFMSATITDKFFFDSFMREDREKVFYHSVDPIFKLETRQIYSFKSLPTINYERLQDEKFVKQWCTLISTICMHHADQKGFIYVNSYDQVKLIRNFLSEDILDRFLFNDSSSNSKIMLDKFMNDKTDKVLVSPVIKEGYSFDHDISRFQIIAKIPFSHQKVIKEFGEDYYYNSTVHQLLQIYGRSTRDENDWSKTYLVDNGWKMLKPYLPKWFLDSIIEK